MSFLISLNLFVRLTKVPNSRFSVLETFYSKEVILATVRRQGEADIQEGFANYITMPITKAFIGFSYAMGDLDSLDRRSLFEPWICFFLELSIFFDELAQNCLKRLIDMCIQWL